MTNTYSLHLPLAYIVFTRDEDDKWDSKLVSGNEASTQCLLIAHPEGRRVIHNRTTSNITIPRLEAAVIKAFSFVFKKRQYRNPSTYTLSAHPLL